MKDGYFMKRALEEAEKAGKNDEVPVGAVVVKDGNIIASACNRTRSEASPTRHAEMIAIEEAARSIENERLTGCHLYVTKEPCAMCAGAIVHARIERVVIAARDVRYGACGTVLDVCGNSALNHVPVIEFGLMEKEASSLLKEFFRNKRSTVKNY